MSEGRERAAFAMGVLLMIGLIVGGWLLGSQIKDTRLADRYVTVRGLTERVVKADVAVWTLDFKESGNDLPTVYAQSEHDRTLTLAFLAGQGIGAAEVATGPARVVDRQTSEYQASDKGPRYVVEQSIVVQTGQVDKVAAAEQKSSSLVQQGVILTSNNGQSAVRFNFTGLNAIKPDMITEATKNARAAADRFAADSGSKVGSIRRAEQGIFSITGASGDSVSQENGGPSYGGQEDASVMKKIRVVTTVDYYLEK